jgi:hypothetical protein
MRVILPQRYNSNAATAEAAESTESFEIFLQRLDALCGKLASFYESTR